MSEPLFNPVNTHATTTAETGSNAGQDGPRSTGGNRQEPLGAFVTQRRAHAGVAFEAAPAARSMTLAALDHGEHPARWPARQHPARDGHERHCPRRRGPGDRPGRTSPYLRGAERLWNRLQKRDWLLATYRKLHRMDSRSAEVEAAQALTPPTSSPTTTPRTGP